jgi:tetracycline repressor-like protein
LKLIIDAIKHSYNEAQSFPDTGELRQDMIDYIRLVIKRTKNPIARGAMLALHNCTDSALTPLAEELLGKAREIRINLVQRGIDRGELPKNTDPALISDLFSSPILRKLLTFGENVKISYGEAVIDTVIAGAKAYSPKRRTK